ncbi:hypothetical protein GCM10010502_02180 [Kitasatospora aureofaciens]|uniref:Uncharacterized protein n=1 Tax=Kitasatospora aureofaciens TaxID=1894 RepID=A0A8H9LN07_KITAU|nr:hypothetical protein GCM10010502_02180 [Kitasatospora aureofaciens]
MARSQARSASRSGPPAVLSELSTVVTHAPRGVARGPADGSQRAAGPVVGSPRGAYAPEGIVPARG